MLLHEGLGPVGHPEDIDRVRVLESFSLTIARVAVADVVTMLFGAATAEMPFPEVRRCVAVLAQQLGEGHLLVADRLAVVAFDQAVAYLGRRGLRPAQPGRRHSGLQTDPRRRADGCWRVTVAEAHALGGEFLKVGRLEVIAAGFRDVRMHAYGEPVPVLVVGKNQDDVRPGHGRCVGSPGDERNAGYPNKE